MNDRYHGPIVFGVLLAALSFAPAARGQSQSQTNSQGQAQSDTKASGTEQNTSSTPSSTPSSTSSSASSSATSPAKAQTGSSNEPQMQSQEAAPADSLGEAARKARAQKAKASGAKVYTEEKIAGLSGHGVSVVGDGNQSGAGDSSAAENSYAGAGAKGAAAPAGKNDEQVWRDKARAIHNQMSQIDDRIAKIQEEIQKYGAVSFDPTKGLQQNVIYVEDRNAQIKQLEAQKARLQSQMDALEEEGRKAGADSGWFR